MGNIGIYHSDNAETFRDCLIQSILLQNDEVASDDERWFGEDSAFDVGQRAEEMRERVDKSPNKTGSLKLRDREFFSHFKRDLTRNRGRTAEDMRRHRSVPKRNHLDEPREVATAFIGTVLRKIIKDLPPGEDANYKVYFTQPAGEKTASQTYRDTIRDKIFPRLKDGFENLGVDIEFPDKNAIFEYESYVAYQYALRDQNLDDNFEEGDRPSFLIVDVGGSTTDVSFVQSKLGSNDSPYPVSESIRYAGNDYDKILLREINQSNKEPYSEQELKNRQYKALQEVKKGKEKASRSGAPVSIDIGQRNFTIGESSILESFDEWWSHVEDTLAECIDRAKKRGKREEDKKIMEFDSIDSVFLVGGGSQLSVGDDNLIEDYISTQFDSIDESAVVTPSDLNVDPSLTASLGHAAMVRDNDSAVTGLGSQGQQTSVIEGRFKDDEGRILRFGREEREPGEFSMADSELRNSPVAEGAVNLFDTEFDLGNGGDTTLDWKDFSGVATSGEEKPQTVQIEVKSRAQTEWTLVDEINIDEPQKDEIRHKLEIIGPKQINGSVKYRHMSSIGEKSRFSEKANDNTVTEIVKNWDEHPEIEIPLKKRYDYDDEDILIFFDLGMNNTSVSIYDPLENIGEESALKVSVGNISINTKDKGEEGNNKNEKEEKEEVNKANENNEKEDKKEYEEEIYGGIIMGDFNSENGSGIKSPEKYARGDGSTNKVFSFSSFKYFVLKEKGYSYPHDVLRDVWTSATSRSRRLTILTGPPGMGKTSLVGLLAEFFNLHSQISEVETSDNALDPELDSDNVVRNAPRLGEEARELYYCLVPVSPSWLSPDDLLGRYDQIKGRFRATEFLRFCLYADRVYNICDRDFLTARRFFACLDEFNIAHPEKYLSSLLSLMEEEYESPNSSKKLHRYEEGDKEPVSVRIPHNLKIFGTINSDYTTNDISPKVHDRSITIRLSPEHKLIREHAEKVKDEHIESGERESILEGIFEDKGGKLIESMQKIGYECGRPVSFRTVESITEYVKNIPLEYVKSKDEENIQSEIVKKFFLSKLPGGRSIDTGKFEKELSKVSKGKNEYSLLSSLPEIEEIASSIKNGKKGINSI